MSSNWPRFRSRFRLRCSCSAFDGLSFLKRKVAPIAEHSSSTQSGKTTATTSGSGSTSFKVDRRSTTSLTTFRSLSVVFSALTASSKNLYGMSHWILVSVSNTVRKHASVPGNGGKQNGSNASPARLTPGEIGLRAFSSIRLNAVIPSPVPIIPTRKGSLEGFTGP